MTSRQDTRTVQQWLQTSELKVQEKVKLSSVSVSVLSSLSSRSEIYLSIGIDTGGVTPALQHSTTLQGSLIVKLDGC